MYRNHVRTAFRRSLLKSFYIEIMQNIVKIIEGENHLVIVLRDVTSNQYTAQAYRKQHNGEFTRVGQLARTESPAYAENVGRAWMQNDSLIVLANR